MRLPNPASMAAMAEPRASSSAERLSHVVMAAFSTRLLDTFRTWAVQPLLADPSLGTSSVIPPLRVTLDLAKELPEFITSPSVGDLHRRRGSSGTWRPGVSVFSTGC
jgi:hypothetical protein